MHNFESKIQNLRGKVTNKKQINIFFSASQHHTGTVSNFYEYIFLCKYINRTRIIFYYDLYLWNYFH